MSSGPSNTSLLVVFPLRRSSSFGLPPELGPDDLRHEKDQTRSLAFDVIAYHRGITATIIEEAMLSALVDMINDLAFAPQNQKIKRYLREATCGECN